MEEVLIEALADKVALLVLDNCEHLLDAVADIAERLSRHCPHLVILATSREPLDIEGEVVWRLSPLPVVEPGRGREGRRGRCRRVGAPVRGASPLGQPAVRAHRRQRVDVARIVAQVNGIPLAIELAAAALGDRPLSGVVTGLADRFSLLTHGRRTAPPRHQTLRAALEWSLDLLPKRRAPPLRSTRRIRRRRDHRGHRRGVRRPARCAVATSRAILRHLARASLLVPHAELPERWSMLESVRELAAIELEAAGEDDVLATRHRTWFALAGRAGRSRHRPHRSTGGHARPRRRPRQRSARHRDGACGRRRHHRASHLYRDGAVLDLTRRLDGGMRAAPGGVGPARRQTTDDCEGGRSLPWGASCCCAATLPKPRRGSLRHASLRPRPATT